ncbi:hypothetical protein [Crateriforma conspicua]|uniref:Uncharacterized protein n=1 Tax=Crateriforma conspicua TaxID=2527996 RepID=A0A5C5Y5R4_9PLAN|nr:hypothetical protein [Crateriforma conspicua]TWT70269.1 hypothetical protein Pan14r_25740 [Crateriforma conspicua]
MISERRTIDRRRRVLYSAQKIDEGVYAPPGNAASRRLREARRPATAYGSHVNRRLRGRWFSLVPIKRRSMIALGAAVMSVVSLLAVMHYLALAWPALASRPDLARPFRLDRGDSFGSWTVTMAYALTAGSSLLVYQLRRYRNDDYRGHYRLWRIVLLTSLIASLQSATDLVSWGGGLIDALFGSRVALSGGDWLRILLTFGGVVFALRLLVEVSRCKAALAMMAAGWIAFAIPIAARWNLIEIDSVFRAWLVTSCPVWACGCFGVSVMAYLRVLLREVRDLEAEPTPFDSLHSMTQRWKQQRAEKQAFKEAERNEREEAAKQKRDQKAEERRQRLEAKRAGKRTAAAQSETESEADSETTASAKTPTTRNRTRAGQAVQPSDKADDENVAEATESKPAKKRSGWGLKGWRKRSAKSADPESTVDDLDDESDHESASQESDGDAGQTKRKRGWGWSRKKASKSSGQDESGIADEQATVDDDVVTEASDSDALPQKKSRGLKGWFGGRKNKPKSGDDDGHDADEGDHRDRGGSASHDDDRSVDEEADDFDSDDVIDEQDIDWTSLSKAERRRMRKQLKRRGRAA